MKMVFFPVHAAVLNLISVICAYVLWNVAVGFKTRDFQTLKNSNIPLMSLITMSKCTLLFSSNAWTMFSALVLTLLALVCAQARSLISVRCRRHRLPVLALPHWKSSLIKKPRYLLPLLLLFLCFPPFSLPVSTWVPTGHPFGAPESLNNPGIQALTHRIETPDIQLPKCSSNIPFDSLMFSTNIQAFLFPILLQLSSAFDTIEHTCFINTLPHLHLEYSTFVSSHLLVTP